jgi:hypothetical protein
VVEQHTHANDLTGHLLPEGNWTLLCLPAEFEQRTTYTFPRSSRKVERTEGDLLWTEREGSAELDSAKKRVGSYAYNCQWLQRPVSREGNYFKREWFRHYQVAPAHFSRLVQSWDTAFKQKSISDYSAMVTVGVVSDRGPGGAQPGFYILNGGRVEFPQLKRFVVEFECPSIPTRFDRGHRGGSIADSGVDGRYEYQLAVRQGRHRLEFAC